MIRRIDQLLAGFAEDDAISRDALLLRDAFRELGIESDLFVPKMYTDPAAAARVRPLESYRGAPDGAVVLHDVLAPETLAVFQASPARKILRYHNITPGACFRAYDPAMADRLDAARAALAGVARQADAVWACSAYNAGELADSGLANVKVLPLLFGEPPAQAERDPDVAARYGGGLTNILFVGRLAPNKAIEELMMAFHGYHRAIEPRSRLIIAGSERSCPRYTAMLRLLARALDLPNVCFEGFVSPAGLATLYGCASLFATASRHEGYCLPLVEAMSRGVPVLARRTGGMPEALGGAGMMFDDLTARQLGELMAEAIHNPDVRGAMLQSQARRMEAIRARRPAGEIQSLITDLIR